MPFLLIAGMFLCAAPQIHNKTPYDWNENDQWVYETAIARCGKKYQFSPCLKRFYKNAERDYGAVCGPALRSREEAH